MNRRDFLKLAGLSGVALAAPAALTRRARAAEVQRHGTFYITVHAGGGWDPTSLCDPKGRLSEEQENPLNMYFADDIGTAGNLRYAPVAWNEEFFKKHYQRTMVINGIDTATNGHDSGTRNVWSGRLSEGYPAFTAIVAASFAPDKPMTMLSNGGYDFTAGLVAPTRVGNTDSLLKLAFPNRIDAAKEDSTPYHTTNTMQRIEALRRQQLDERIARAQLPRRLKSMIHLRTVIEGSAELKLLTEVLPDDLDASNNPLKKQAQLAIAAYKAGLAVSANLTYGGFDTHSLHDQRHFPRLTTLMQGVDFIWEEAERQGVAGEVVVAVGSDFGRTPGYNSGNGKDHWSVTSMLLMGKGIPGNAVVGGSDEGHRPLMVNPASLKISDAEGAIRIRPEHIHRALRDHAGITGNDIDFTYPLSAEQLPLLA